MKKILLLALLLLLSACALAGQSATSTGVGAPLAPPLVDTGPVPYAFPELPEGVTQEPLFDTDIAMVLDNGMKISWAELDEWEQQADIDTEFNFYRDPRCKTRKSKEVLLLVQNGGTAYFAGKFTGAVPMSMKPIAIYGKTGTQEYMHIFGAQRGILIAGRHHGLHPLNPVCPYWSFGVVAGLTGPFATSLVDMAWGADRLPLLIPEHNNSNVGYYPPENWVHPTTSPFRLSMP